MQLSGYTNETPRQNIFNQTDLTYTLQMTPENKHMLLAGMEFGNQRSDTNRNNARWLNPITAAPTSTRLSVCRPSSCR